MAFSARPVFCSRHRCFVSSPHPVPVRQSLNVPTPWQPLICFLSLWIYLLCTHGINGSINYVAFCVWLLSLRSCFRDSSTSRNSLSHVPLFATPWSMQSMELSRPEYWSGLPCPPAGDLPNPGIEHRSPALQADSLPAEPQGKPKNTGVGSPFSRGDSRHRNGAGGSCITGGFFTS